MIYAKLMKITYSLRFCAAELGRNQSVSKRLPNLLTCEKITKHLTQFGRGFLSPHNVMLCLGDKRGEKSVNPIIPETTNF